MRTQHRRCSPRPIGCVSGRRRESARRDQRPGRRGPRRTLAERSARHVLPLFQWEAEYEGEEEAVAPRRTPSRAPLRRDAVLLGRAVAGPFPRPPRPGRRGPGGRRRGADPAAAAPARSPRTGRRGGCRGPLGGGVPLVPGGRGGPSVRGGRRPRRRRSRRRARRRGRARGGAARRSTGRRSRGGAPLSAVCWLIQMRKTLSDAS